MEHGMDVVYLDNNATTKVDEAVLEEMLPFFCERYGNPSSVYEFGSEVKQSLDLARSRVASFIGAKPAEIVFTACGTESDSTAIENAVRALPERKHLITSAVEHLAVLSKVESYRALGYVVDIIGVDGEGRFDMDAYRRVLDDDTALVSVMWANNETGVIFPVEEIAALAKEHGALVHVDAVQVAGKIPIDMASSCIDTLALSGHKFHAPKGVGVLFVREGIPFHSFMVGGHQERNRRAGTENVAGIVGLGKACELASAHLEDERVRVRGLRDKLEAELVERMPFAVVLGGRAERTPNTLDIAFPYIEEDAILQALSDRGICASSGSACNSRTLDPSHVLTAMGVPAHVANGAIRFSLSRYSTEEDVNAVVDALPGIVEQIRACSIWDKES